MANVTLAIDDRLLKSARAHAKRHGTTLNALIRQRLMQVIDEEARREESRRGLIALMESPEGVLGRSIGKIDRDEMYGGPLLSRHKHTGVRRSRRKG